MSESQEVKITRLETQMNNVTSEIAEVKALVKEVIVKVDQASTVTSDMLVIKSNMLGFETKLEKLEKKRWLQNILSGVLGAVLSVLIAYFVTNIGK